MQINAVRMNYSANCTPQKNYAQTFCAKLSQKERARLMVSSDYNQRFNKFTNLAERMYLDIDYDNPHDRQNYWGAMIFSISPKNIDAKQKMLEAIYENERFQKKAGFEFSCSLSNESASNEIKEALRKNEFEDSYANAQKYFKTATSEYFFEEHGDEMFTLLAGMPRDRIENMTKIIKSADETNIDAKLQMLDVLTNEKDCICNNIPKIIEKTDNENLPAKLEAFKIEKELFNFYDKTTSIYSIYEILGSITENADSKNIKSIKDMYEILKNENPEKVSASAIAIFNIIATSNKYNYDIRTKTLDFMSRNDIGKKYERLPSILSISDKNADIGARIKFYEATKDEKHFRKPTCDEILGIAPHILSATGNVTSDNVERKLEIYKNCKKLQLDNSSLSDMFSSNNIKRVEARFEIMKKIQKMGLEDDVWRGEMIAQINEYNLNFAQKMLDDKTFTQKTDDNKRIALIFMTRALSPSSTARGKLNFAKELPLIMKEKSEIYDILKDRISDNYRDIGNLLHEVDLSNCNLIKVLARNENLSDKEVHDYLKTYEKEEKEMERKIKNYFSSHVGDIKKSASDIISLYAISGMLYQNDKSAITQKIENITRDYYLKDFYPDDKEVMCARAVKEVMREANNEYLGNKNVDSNTKYNKISKFLGGNNANKCN